MTAPVITFFMIVTDRDMVIADYAVRSYAKITSIPFTLVIYNNWVLSELRERHFTEWRKLPYVEIWETSDQTDDRKPQDRSLWGPFELGSPIWDRELKKLTASPYHATVDADCEILDPVFIDVMLRRLNENPRLVAMSTDYNAVIPSYYDSYSDEVITLNERWHTHFCIYKRAALDCPVSHEYHAELQPGSATRSVWDDAGYLQRALRMQMGYEIAVLDRRFQRCFIHYGAFGHNRHIDEHTVARYRRIRIVRKRGLFGLGDPFTRLAAKLVERVMFPLVDRGTFVPGWAKDAPGRYKGHADI
jgi:hypothetical protein